MKTTELIAVLNAISTRYGAQALNRWVNIDAIDSCDANYVVVAVWNNDEVSISSQMTLINSSRTHT